MKDTIFSQGENPAVYGGRESDTYTLSQINNFGSIKLFTYSIILIYVSLTMAFSSLPSISDAKLPLKILRKQLFTKDSFL